MAISLRFWNGTRWSSGKTLYDADEGTPADLIQTGT